jgi:hypothetical protein
MQSLRENGRLIGSPGANGSIAACVKTHPQLTPAIIT